MCCRLSGVDFSSYYVLVACPLQETFNIFRQHHNTFDWESFNLTAGRSGIFTMISLKYYKLTDVIVMNKTVVDHSQAV